MSQVPLCSDILYAWLEDMGVAVGYGTSVGVKAACPAIQPSTSSFLKESLHYSLLHLHKLASFHPELVEDVQE